MSSFIAHGQINRKNNTEVQVGAPEKCNGIDDDRDGLIDENCHEQTDVGVVGFTLINANNEQPIRTISAGEVIDLASLPSRNLNIRADSNPAVVGSVKFTMTGTARRNKWDNVAPYALFGDDGGNYNKWVAGPGNYTLTATPYSAADAQGTAGIPLTISFSVIDQPAEVVSFTLINANNGQPILTISPGEVINLAGLPSRNLNIRADTNPAIVGSVKFVMTGTATINKADNYAPYSLYGDDDGEYNKWTPPVGDYTLTATSYTAGNATGTAGTSLTISFSVIDQPAGMAANKSVQAPKKGQPDLPQPLTLYPNPTQDGRIKVQLAGELQGKISYRLVSSLGSTLAVGTINLTDATNTLQFDLSDQIQATGVYYLRLEGSNVQKVLKIMRE